MSNINFVIILRLYGEVAPYIYTSHSLPACSLFIISKKTIAFQQQPLKLRINKHVNSAPPTQPPPPIC